LAATTNDRLVFDDQGRFGPFEYGPFEYGEFRKNGEPYSVILGGVKFKHSSGKLFVWKILQDISERKQAEQKLQQTNAELTQPKETA
jgi:two-component system sensor histidine kinase/response regulator